MWVVDTCRSCTDQPSWTASPKMSLIQQFTDAGTWAIRIEPRSAGKIYSLRCRFRRRASQGGFPSVRHAKSFEDACEIVGAPAMAQYERSRDGPRVLAYRQFTWRLSEQSLEAIIHVQLLEEDLHQRRRPPKQGGRGNRRTNRPRSNVPAPAFRRCLCRSGATSVLTRARSAT